ncbi:hypothetical protein ACMAVI_004382 [Burkholderia cenocepacia]|uniref:hypothetical protein n=1 Tax=Burkholderia cepacia complex TaxID=87882 RepID=UPI00158BC88A|nr:hypothetical protein [Burkholderia cenocepacia]MBR8089990.1 hypothetical protein [Burkholderia cenocepacia]MEB2608098.1 hypothetical protein [Burkholderia cenocepacia]
MVSILCMVVHAAASNARPVAATNRDRRRVRWSTRAVLRIGDVFEPVDVAPIECLPKHDLRAAARNRDARAPAASAASADAAAAAAAANDARAGIEFKAAGVFIAVRRCRGIARP